MKRDYLLTMQMDVTCPFCASDNVAGEEPLALVGANVFKCASCVKEFGLEIRAIQHTDKTPSGVRALAVCGALAPLEV
jgi:transposase-like protein